MAGRYAIEIFYSEESAFGETEEEALREVKVAIDLWLETAGKEGRQIPKPFEKELLKTFVESRGA